MGAGHRNTLALGLLNEAVGLRLPIVAVPWPNAALAADPVFARSIGALRSWGITVILDAARLPQPEAREAAAFPWDELRAVLPGLRTDRAEPQAGEPPAAQIVSPIWPARNQWKSPGRV